MRLCAVGRGVWFGRGPEFKSFICSDPEAFVAHFLAAADVAHERLDAVLFESLAQMKKCAPICSDAKLGATLSLFLSESFVV